METVFFMLKVRRNQTITGEYLAELLEQLTRALKTECSHLAKKRYIFFNHGIAPTDTVSVADLNFHE